MPSPKTAPRDLQALPDDAYFSWPDLCALLANCSLSTAKRAIATDPDAPDKTQLMPNRVGFMAGPTRRWLKLLAERPADWWVGRFVLAWAFAGLSRLHTTAWWT
jgi:hypothetical protein